MKIVGRFIACSCLAATLAPSIARSAAPVAMPPSSSQLTFASHKALYSVTLTGTRPGSDYVDVNGKMSLEFADKCSVWTTRQKSILLTVAGDGTEERSNSEFRSSESKAGDLYTFYLHQAQGNDTTDYQGSATRNGPNGSGIAEYTQPDHKTYKLPARFLFQVAQQVKLIESARKGVRFLRGEMFDGTEGGGASYFNAVILKPTASAARASSIKNPLLDSPAHRVRIAFYPAAGSADPGSGAAADDGDEPEYEMTMTLHDNGVVSDYDYDYKDFSVHGALEAIQALPPPRC